jgi:hypothetical protein
VSHFRLGGDVVAKSPRYRTYGPAEFVRKAASTAHITGDSAPPRGFEELHCDHYEDSDYKFSAVLYLSPTTTEILSGQAQGLVGGETGIVDALTHEGLRYAALNLRYGRPLWPSCNIDLITAASSDQRAVCGSAAGG